MTARPAGIKAVATRAGVSVGTVSNVLNRPAQVSAATRERVERAMEELDFVRNSSASALKAGRSSSLGLVVLDIGNPFFTDVARGVEQVAADHGYAVLLCHSDQSLDRQDTQLRFLEEQRVDGALLTPVSGGLARAEQLRARGTRVVLVDEPGQDDRCSVAVDDVRGGEAAGEHLLSSGRRSIVHITSGQRQVVDRGTGLRRAVKAAGLDARKVVSEVRLDALSGALGFEAVAAALRAKPDAIFCANDVVALGVLRGLLEAGVSVPDDVALVGYDDIEFAATAAVPLTSIRQPAVQIGRTATTLLLEEIEDPGAHAHQQVLFRPELVLRRSS